jgi:hypothetical protein
VDVVVKLQIFLKSCADRLSSECGWLGEEMREVGGEKQVGR